MPRNPALPPPLPPMPPQPKSPQTQPVQTQPIPSAHAKAVTDGPPSLPVSPPALTRHRPRRHSILGRALFGIAVIAAMAGGGAWLMNASIEPAEDVEGQVAPTRHELLADMKSWGYQLQHLDPVAAAGSLHDLLVIDEAFDGPVSASAAGAAAGSRVATRRAQMLRALKRKPDGGRRLVLAYLSIGEAEDYRAYWDQSWVVPSRAAAAPRAPTTSAAGGSDFSAISPAHAGTSSHAGNLGPAGKLGPAGTSSPAGNLGPAETGAAGSGIPPPAKPAMSSLVRVPSVSAPAWLAEENKHWRGNFRVRYWDEDWQALIFGRETAALERIVSAGFDGVYLDRADVYQASLKQRPDAKADMASLIQRISARGRALSPGFVVVMQNAEELLDEPKVRAALDAVAKEDLLFGVDGDARPNSEAEITASQRYLKKAQRQGLPVLAVEYISDEKLVAAARARLDANGFVPYFAPRALDRLQGPR